MTARLVEARIRLANASAIIEVLCRRLAPLCTVISADASTRILSFEAGRALLRTAGNDLLLRVEANDLTTCHAIEVLIEGNLAEIRDVHRTVLLWIPAEKAPFAALTNYSAVARALPAPRFHDEGAKGGQS